MNRSLKNNQVIRFATVGGLNTAIDFGILFALKALGLPEVAANIISTSTAFVFSFFANKKYTFRTSGTSVIREMILFVVVTLFGLWVLQTAIIYLLLPIFTELLGSAYLSLLITKVIATIVSLLWNYFFYSRVVFKKQ